MELLKIDLDKILRDRMGRKARFLPRFVTRALERFVHQKELNRLLEATYPAEGSDFAEALYRELDVEIEVEGLENIPKQGRFILASNHPLGGMDGIGIVKVLGRHFGDDHLRVLVNDMLMHVEPLRRVFLPINKYGAQGRAAAAEINRAYESDLQMVIFPAGLVSRLHPDGSIKDLEWHKSFVQRAVRHKRDIIPMRFEGLNRPRFYKLAYWRKKLGIKVNLEQAMLPAELVACRGKRFRLRVMPPVSWESLAERLAAGESASHVAENLRHEIMINDK